MQVLLDPRRSALVLGNVVEDPGHGVVARGGTSSRGFTDNLRSGSRTTKRAEAAVTRSVWNAVDPCVPSCGPARSSGHGKLR